MSGSSAKTYSWGGDGSRLGWTGESSGDDVGNAFRFREGAEAVSLPFFKANVLMTDFRDSSSLEGGEEREEESERSMASRGAEECAGGVLCWKGRLRARRRSTYVVMHDKHATECAFV